MAITVVLTQTRPNTGVAFHEGSAEMLALIKEAEDSGKIIDNGGGNDETDLIKTRSLHFQMMKIIYLLEIMIYVRIMRIVGCLIMIKMV